MVPRTLEVAAGLASCQDSRAERCDILLLHHHSRVGAAAVAEEASDAVDSIVGCCCTWSCCYPRAAEVQAVALVAVPVLVPLITFCADSATCSRVWFPRSVLANKRPNADTSKPWLAIPIDGSPPSVLPQRWEFAVFAKSPVAHTRVVDSATPFPADTSVVLAPRAVGGRDVPVGSLAPRPVVVPLGRRSDGWHIPLPFASRRVADRYRDSPDVGPPPVPGRPS